MATVSNTRPRDALGRPLPYGSTGVERAPSGVVRTPDETLGEAQRLLDEGLPFHAHEILEDAWKAAPPADRELWRGLAQLAVGSTHAARGNRAGALSLLHRGSEAIAAYAPESPYELDITAIRAWVDDAIAQVEHGVPVVLPAPPVTGK